MASPGAWRMRSRIVVVHAAGMSRKAGEPTGDVFMAGWTCSDRGERAFRPASGGVSNAAEEACFESGWELAPPVHGGFANLHDFVPRLGGQARPRKQLGRTI